MKKLLAVLAIVALPLAFGSCEKSDLPGSDQKFCWECWIKATVPSYPQANQTSSMVVCDKTQEEIDKIERDGTFTTTQSGITVYTKTECSKKP